MTAKQQLLGTVAPGRTTAAYRFERETLRRGGPLAVQGKRWTKKPKKPKVPIRQQIAQVKTDQATARRVDAMIREAARRMRMQ